MQLNEIYSKMKGGTTVRVKGKINYDRIAANNGPYTTVDHDRIAANKGPYTTMVLPLGNPLKRDLIMELVRQGADMRSFITTDPQCKADENNVFDFYSSCLNEMKRTSDFNFEKFKEIIDVHEAYAKDLTRAEIDEARYTIANADIYHDLKIYYINHYDDDISGITTIKRANCVANTCREHIFNTMYDHTFAYNLTGKNQTRMENNIPDIMQEVFENSLDDVTNRLKADEVDVTRDMHPRDPERGAWHESIWCDYDTALELAKGTLYPYNNQMTKSDQYDRQDNMRVGSLDHNTYDNAHESMAIGSFNLNGQEISTEQQNQVSWHQNLTSEEIMEQREARWHGDPSNPNPTLPLKQESESSGSSIRDKLRDIVAKENESENNYDEDYDIVD